MYAPLRDLVAAALERCLAAGTACSADDVVRMVHVLLDEGGGATAAARHIGGSDGLVGLLACIEGSPPVFRRFARDVLALKLGFGRAPAPELRVLVELVLVLLRQRAPSGVAGDASGGQPGGGLSCVRLLLLQRDPAAGAALAQVRVDTGMGAVQRALARYSLRSCPLHFLRVPAGLLSHGASAGAGSGGRRPHRPCLR